MWMSNLILLIFTAILLVMIFFMFDDTVLKGYFATKLRKRFNVEDLK